MAASLWPAHSRLGRCFADKREDLLVKAACHSAELACERDGEAALRLPALTVLLLVRAASMISNGGYGYFFEQRDHRSEETLAALERIGAGDAAASLREALRVFPDGRPHADWDERMRFMALDEDRIRWAMLGGDELYLAALQPMLTVYLRANESAFVGMPEPVLGLPPMPVPYPDAEARSVALWLMSRGATVGFHEHFDADGATRLFPAEVELPRGALTFCEIVFDALTCDSGALLTRFVDLQAASTCERMSFCDTGLRLADLTPLARHPRLRQLQLSSMAVTIEGERVLAAMPRLQRLQFVACAIEPPQQARLRALLSRTQIEFL